jgi:putative nucleotidyltransferase with HDIG domain
MKWITNKNWEYLCQQYDWISNMHGVLQSPEHHAEGDVATHTQMVLQALINLPEYSNLTEEEREIIWMAALLHDVEKRSTTFTEADGNIVSPGHAKKGAQTARQILFTQFDLSFSTREQIVYLVRYHGFPIWIMEKENPQRALLEASLQVNTRWLALLAKADMLGRVCKDQMEMLERIEFFEAYCKEQNCWGKPYAFVNGLSKYWYFHKENYTAEYSPYDDTICEVVVLSGLPGMGKDNYIRNFYKDWPVVSLDAIRKLHKLKPEDKSTNGWVAQQAKEQARMYLRSKQSFVWNATNITLQMRSQLIELLTSYKARVKLVYVERPYKVWIKQNADRSEMVPQNVIEKMLYKLEVPKLSEAHEVVFVV